MPMIHVYMLEGRTGDQKRRIIEGMTSAMVDVCGSKVERVGVIIHELPAENWGRGGAPMSDEIRSANGSRGTNPGLSAGSRVVDGAD
jgi:4-oxalocrotonate tautomerase